MFKIETREIFNLLTDTVPGINIYENEPMRNHTSFRIGGPADIFVSPKTEEEILKSISFFKTNNIPYTIMGNGSNLLVADEGVRSCVVCIGRDFSYASCIDDTIYASAGTLLSRIASLALENELTGFEFASGIPGTLGGAIVMNAGAYGGEMKDVIVTTKYIDRDGNVRKCTRTEHEFLYRKSRFKEGEIILSSSIKLQKGDPVKIRSYMNELNAKRRDKQPLEYPSAGSTFKRPDGYFAAKLIDDAGLRGYRIGDAMVSDKHTGFVVNVGNATFKDVTELMEHIKNIVYDKYGVTLEAEVRILK